MSVPARTDQMTPARWGMLLSLYVTQYLGLGFFLVAFVAILRQRGMPLENLGLVYLLGLTWMVKFLWSPLVDRFGSARLGHYRGWLIAMQAAMIATLAAIGGLDLDADLPLIFGLSFLFAFFSATQDIAADGLACRLLSPEQRGVANGMQSAGGLLGNVLGGGVVLMLYPVLEWRGSLLLLAGLTAVTLVQVVAFREPAGRHGAGGSVFAYVARGWTFWRGRGRGRWLLMLVVYPAGISLAYALLTPLLVDAGWSIDRIGFTLNVVGALVGVASSLAAGWLIRRLGRRLSLIGAALGQIAGLFFLLAPAGGVTSTLAVTVAVVAFYLAYSPVSTVLSTLMMDHAEPASPATDFTLQYSLFFTGGLVAAGLGTTLAGSIGYVGVTAVAIATATVALGLSLGFRLPAQAATPALGVAAPDAN